jgi:hypothetical protein
LAARELIGVPGVVPMMYFESPANTGLAVSRLSSKQYPARGFAK